MNVDGYWRKGRRKKRWMDCVKHDKNVKKVTFDEWKKKSYCGQENDDSKLK